MIEYGNTKTRSWSVALGIFWIMLTTRVVANYPIPFILEVEAALIVVMFLYVTLIYFLRPLYVGRLRLDGIEVYILLLLCLPLYSAWRAYEVFGQPFFYGVLCQRYIWISVSALVLINGFRSYVISKRELELSLVSLSWISLIGYVAIQLFVEPAHFADELQFVGISSDGYIFKFETIPLVFGFYYYLMKWILRRSGVGVLAIMPFLAALLFVDKRSLHVSMFVALLITGLLHFGYKKSLLIAGRMLLVVVGVFVFAYSLAPQSVERVFTRFGNAIEVVLTGERGEDYSSNARIDEVLLVLPYVQDNLALGSGDVSSRWEGGYESLLGYFYVSDIGIVGVIFVYGLFGTFLLYAQIGFLKRYELCVFRGGYAPLALSSYAMAITLLGQSLIKAGVIFAPASILFFIVVANYLTRSGCVAEPIE